MAKSTTLTVKITADAKSAAQGFGAAADSAGRFERGVQKASAAAVGVLGGLAAIGKASLDAASALEQSTGGIQAVFGKFADGMSGVASQAAQALGLSQNAYQELATVMGAQLRNMGYAAGEVAGKTQDLIKLGADLAATYGGTTADAVAALSSALKGETDPIERYGIGVKAADVAARMAAEGTDKLTGAAQKQATAAATLGLIYDQAAPAVGQFAAQTDTAAVKQQIANAEFENAKAKLGEGLLPIVTDATGLLADLAEKVGENSETVKAWATGLAALAAVVLIVNGLTRAYAAAVTLTTVVTTIAATITKVHKEGLMALKAVQITVTAAQWAWNAALAANPIGLIVLALVALGVALYAAYQKFEPVRNVVDSVGRALKSAFGFVVENLINPITDALGWLYDKIKAVFDFLGGVGDAIGGVVNDLFGGGTATVQVAGSPLMGAAGGGGSARMYGAVMGATGGGGLVPASAAGGSTTVVNITVEGALDPVSVGRQIDGLVRRYATTVGRRPVALGGLPA